jgi:hypothetical protein
MIALAATLFELQNKRNSSSRRIVFRGLPLMSAALYSSSRDDADLGESLHQVDSLRAGAL